MDDCCEHPADGNLACFPRVKSDNAADSTHGR
jgi:hypothetical protein